MLGITVSNPNDPEVYILDVSVESPAHTSAGFDLISAYLDMALKGGLSKNLEPSTA